MQPKKTSRLFVIQGDPTPLARVRFSRDRAYDAQKQAKLIWGVSLRSQHDETQFEGPLGLDATFYMPIAQSANQKRKDALKDSLHFCKPDISNLLKFIEDCAEGILYHDDCIIAQVMCKKLYSLEPRTEFKVFEL